MKVTSYEISKKLAEIGFKTETHFVWSRRYAGGNKLRRYVMFLKPSDGRLEYEIPAYDLETILGAFPKIFIAIQPLITGITRITIEALIPKKYNHDRMVERVSVEEGGSLVDAAARLLTLLHEKNLVKFNGVKDE